MPYEDFYDDDDYDDDVVGDVHSDGYRPVFRPKGDPAETMMGIELEVGGSWESITEAVRDVDRREDHLYLKTDCSLESGLEIVTHPMTLAFARQYPFPRLLAGLRAGGCHVNAGYGLHIHVDRKAFWRDGKTSATHQMRWLMFIYRNSAQLRRLARRNPSNWGAFHPPQPGELARKAKASRGSYGEARYVAVNCNNPDTFELRFFAATLNRRKLYAALEFADASVKYTRDMSMQSVVSGNALSWPKFARFAYRRNYRFLVDEIERRNVR